MKPPPHIEHEFGVPVPGEILDPHHWTQTGLRKLPTIGRLSWKELFQREAPVVLDLGCGNGRYVIGSALARPTHDHIGLDVLPVVIRYATRRANQRGLSNIRFAVGDARDFLQRLVEPHSVAEIHLYHPQPYYDIAHVHRRLITPEFLVMVHRALAAEGLVYLQTDNPGYWRYMQEIVPIFFLWEEQLGPWADSPQGRTRREIIALHRGLAVFRGVGRARTELDEKSAIRAASQLPPPIFDADRRLRDLDKVE